MKVNNYIHLTIPKYDRRNDDEINNLTKQLREDGAESLQDFFKKILGSIDSTSRILLFVDQLESLYTKCEPDIRSSFLEKLTSLLKLEDFDQIVLLATLDPAGIAKEVEKEEIDQDYQKFIEQSVTSLSPLTDRQLEALIKNPAEQREVEIADDLVKQIIEDLGANKNDLFLLGAILDNLWETVKARDIKKVTTEHYQHYPDNAGSNALDRFANKFFEALDKGNEQELAEGLFLSMIYSIDINKKITIKSKIIETDKYQEVIKKLSRVIKRTDIGGEGKKHKIKIEFAHKKLAENWGLLKKWSVQNSTYFEKARDLENYSKQWKENYKYWWAIHKDRSYLITGQHLREKKEFYEAHKVLLSDEELVESFLNRSSRILNIFKTLVSLAILVLISSAAIALGLFLSDREKKRTEISDRMSYGGKILVTHSNFDKSEGAKKYSEGEGLTSSENIAEKLFEEVYAFLDVAYKSDRSDSENKAKKLFKEAYTFFDGAYKSDRSDPETLIYLNNARVSKWEKEYQSKAYSFAASVPVGTNKHVAIEMLRGIALVQHELNQNCLNKEEKETMEVCKDGIDGKPLKIMIINDDNNIDVATKLAEELVDDNRIMAVVGHNASEVSTAAAEIYQKSGLVMVTPTSFALRFDELDDKFPSRREKNYIFAVSYNYELLMERIIPEMKKQLGEEEPVVLVCFDQKSFDQGVFAKSFVNHGIKTFGTYDREEGRNHVKEQQKDFLCDFSKPDVELGGKLKELFEQQQNRINTIFLASHVNRIGDSVLALRKIKDSLSHEKKIYFFGSPTLYTRTTLELGDEFEDELTLGVGWFPSNSKNQVPCIGPGDPSYKKRVPITAENFYDEARKFWCDPYGRGITWRTAMAYDSTKILIKGLKDATGKDRVSLQSVLADTNFQLDGVTGKIQFYSNCPSNSNTTKVDIKCTPGKRMKIEEDPITLVKIKGGEVPKGYKFYSFEKSD